MLQPLDERKLSALVPDGGNADCGYIREARENLEEYRDLPMGLLCLLYAWDVFHPRLRNDLRELDEGNEKWHIFFYNSPFRTLRLKPGGAEGVIDIYISKKPFISFRIFDNPHNWQVMLKWIWEFGDERQIARSIPQLNPHRLSALLCGNENDYGDDLMAHHLMRNGCEFLESKWIGEGVMHLLMAFDFGPRLSLDRSSPSHEGTGYKRWHITFAHFPFDNLRVLPKTSEGVDVYVSKSKKPPKPFTMTDDPASWQIFLKWIWDYGNKRHIARKKREASQPRSEPKTNSISKPRHAGTSLLHQALRNAGMKAQFGMSLRTSDMDMISEEAGNSTEKIDGEPPSQRRPLQVANANRQVGSPTAPMNDNRDDRKGQLKIQTASVSASVVGNRDFEGRLV